MKDFDVLVDCMGNTPRRGLAKTFAEHLTIVEAPWNFTQGRFAACIKMLSAVSEQLRTEAYTKVLVFCKRGERRSAAVMAVLLSVLCDMEVGAACEHIASRRLGARVTTMTEGGYPPALPEVRQLVTRVRGS